MSYVTYITTDIIITQTLIFWKGKMGQLKELMGKGYTFSEEEPFSFLTAELLCLCCRGTEDTFVFYRRATGML